jgi:hypothetical protein
VVLASVVTDRIGGDQEAEDDAAAGEPSGKPAPEPVGARL